MRSIYRRPRRHLLPAWFGTVALLLGACQQTILPGTLEPTLPPTETSSAVQDGISIDYSSVAQNATVESVPAQPASGGGPYWDGAPQYRLMTFEGYPIIDHLRKPQIFVFPIDDMASANVNMATVAADMYTLLQTHQVGNRLPFLPLLPEGQMLHAQVQFLDFKNGKGVRFLTQLDQGMIAINNYELFYTFQGMTNDGKYYLSVVLPVNSPQLPANSTDGASTPETKNDYPAYLSKTIVQLNQQSAEIYNPNLTKLDKLIGSIEIK